MIAFGSIFQIGAVKLLAALVVFHALAVIDEIVDRQLARKLRNAAHMVFVEVRDQKVIDGFYAGVFGRGRDAVGIPAVIAGPARIDQHGFPRRGHEERRLPAFYVDEIDLEILGGRKQNGSGGGQQDYEQCAHG